MDPIHARCLGIREEGGVTLVCQKSFGHTSPECYDPSHDRHFIAEYRRKKAKRS